MSRPVVITVTGATRSGKTTIALAIQKALLQYGVNVEVSDEPLTEDAKFDRINNTQRYFDALNEQGLEVDIQTVNVGRKPRVV